MTDVTVLRNGPYMLTGDFTVKDAKGNELAVEGDETYLCRCGESESKPFCDGSHEKIGFKSVVRAKES